MTPDMELTVRAPAEASAAAVEAALDDRRAWVLDTLYGLAEQPDPRLGHDFTNGEKLLYRGKKHRLRVSESSVDEPAFTFDGTRFGLRIPRDEETPATERRRAVVDWYVAHAEDVLPSCVATVADGDPVPPVAVTESGRRWIRVDETLTLHWRLVLAPREIVAYVVAHGLARRDHDPSTEAFWEAVDRRVPDSRVRRSWLRHNGAQLRL
nr:YgjP-like metallopeptidase domain-containing protein [Haloplanus sp. XH21]